MKKLTKLSIITGFILLISATLLGQSSKIAVLHNGTSRFFNNLTVALDSAISGDTVYLPGGPISPSSEITINKMLTIIGAGHYPDSTTATYQTIMPSDVVIATGADGGSMIGVMCPLIRFGTNENNYIVDNYRIEKCEIAYLKPIGVDSWYPPAPASQNIYLVENIFNNFHNSAFSNVVFEKNIFNTDVM